MGRTIGSLQFGTAFKHGCGQSCPLLGGEKKEVDGMLAPCASSSLFDGGRPGPGVVGRF